MCLASKSIGVTWGGCPAERAGAAVLPQLRRALGAHAAAGHVQRLRHLPHQQQAPPPARPRAQAAARRALEVPAQHAPGPRPEEEGQRQDRGSAPRGPRGRIPCRQPRRPARYQVCSLIKLPAFSSLFGPCVQRTGRPLRPGMAHLQKLQVSHLLRSHACNASAELLLS